MTTTDGAPGRPVRRGSRGRDAAALTQPARQESLRHHNLGLVLRHVLHAPSPVSRADVAQATGLTRATVSALVERLVAAGLVSELEPAAPLRAGRPAVPLVPARGTLAAVGLELNVDYLGARAVDLAGEVLLERVEHHDLRGRSPEEALDRLGRVADEVLAELAGRGVPVAGTALALPGLVDSVTGPLRLAPNLGWRDVDVVGLLAARPGGSALAAVLPRLGNEADLAARAEAHARRAGGPASFVYVSGEIGVGGAVVLDGHVFGGRHGWSGEIGHMVLGSPAEAEPRSLEQHAGQDALLATAGLPAGSTVADLRAAADAGDPGARSALAAAGTALGLALASVVNVLDLPHVVLGGIYGELAGHLAAPVLHRLRERVIWAGWAPVEVSAAQAGRYPAMTGGALAVLEQLLDHPARWLDVRAGAAQVAAGGVAGGPDDPRPDPLPGSPGGLWSQGADSRGRAPALP